MASITISAWVRAVSELAISVCSSMMKNKFIRSQPTLQPSANKFQLCFDLKEVQITFIKKGISQGSEKIWKVAFSIVSCFVMIEEFYSLKSHLLNAAWALGLKALNESHHSDDAFLQEE